MVYHIFISRKGRGKNLDNEIVMIKKNPHTLRIEAIRY